MKLIVYGTLRIGNVFHWRLPSDKGTCKIVKVVGFKMYAFPYGFPGVFKSNNADDYFIAELWDFQLNKDEENELLNVLDKVEGTDVGYYTRTLLNVLDNEKAYLYTCNLPLNGAKQIKDWNDYCDNGRFVQNGNRQYRI